MDTNTTGPNATPQGEGHQTPPHHPDAAPNHPDPSTPPAASEPTADPAGHIAGDAALKSDGVPLTKALGPALPLVLAAALLPALGGFYLLSRIGDASTWLEQNQAIALAVYIGFFAITSGAALLPTYAQSFVGGFVFGTVRGSVGAVAGYFVGAVLGYELGRVLGGAKIGAIVERSPKARAIRNAFVGQHLGFWRTTGNVALLRLPFNSPFAMTNLVMAGVGVPRVPFWIGTLLGMMPRTVLVVWIGAEVALAAGTLDEAAIGQRPSWYLPVAIGSAVVVLGVVTTIANRALRRLEAEPNTELDTQPDTGASPAATDPRDPQA